MRPSGRTFSTRPIQLTRKGLSSKIETSWVPVFDLCSPLLRLQQEAPEVADARSEVDGRGYDHKRCGEPCTPRSASITCHVKRKYGFRLFPGVTRHHPLTHRPRQPGRILAKRRAKLQVASRLPKPAVPEETSDSGTLPWRSLLSSRSSRPSSSTLCRKRYRCSQYRETVDGRRRQHRQQRSPLLLFWVIPRDLRMRSWTSLATFDVCS